MTWRRASIYKEERSIFTFVSCRMDNDVGRQLNV
jgi:hypothetical protein